MAGFVALSVALTMVVLALLLRPLWRGQPKFASGIAATLALSMFALYGLVGTPAALDPAARQAPATMQAAVAQLEAALQRDPGQLEGWRLLGRAYSAGQQPAKARAAFARAAALAPQQPDVLVEAAEASALAAADRRFDAQAVAQLERALQLQPQHQRARWFLGIAQRQAGKPAEAARTWEALLTRVDAKTATSLRPQIDAARAEAGLTPLAPVTAASNGNGLTVKVALDPGFAARVRLDGNASVFVIARVPHNPQRPGPRMPVAVEKRNVRELPLTARLDDGDSPMPTRKLSTLKEVELIARLSASGNAIRQESDIESAPVLVLLPATKPIQLNIGK